MGIYGESDYVPLIDTMLQVKGRGCLQLLPLELHLTLERLNELKLQILQVECALDIGTCLLGRVFRLVSVNLLHVFINEHDTHRGLRVEETEE
jgi:hypothetical protein